MASSTSDLLRRELARCLEAFVGSVLARGRAGEGALELHLDEGARELFELVLFSTAGRSGA